MATISLFKSIENKHEYTEVKITFKRYVRNSRAHTIEIINSKYKEMKQLPKEQQGSCENVKICFICKEKLGNKFLKDKNYRQVRDHYHYTGE